MADKVWVLEECQFREGGHVLGVFSTEEGVRTYMTSLQLSLQEATPDGGGGYYWYWKEGAERHLSADYWRATQREVLP